MANVLLKPSGGNTVRPERAYRSRTVASTAAGSELAGWWNTAVSAVPVYSTYTSMSPDARAIADERAAQVQAAVDGQPGMALDRLCDQLTENQLFGEVLRADDDDAARAACG